MAMGIREGVDGAAQRALQGRYHSGQHDIMR
jgi:hypothetical protein